MGILKDKFADLKKTIVGTTTTDIDQKLDSAVKDITAYRSNQGRNSYIELIKSMIAKNGSFSMGSGSGGLFSQAITPATFGQGSRISRYKMYEAIVSNISYCNRALNVLVDNILSPDDITKISLEINPSDYLEDETPTDSKTKYITEIVNKLKLEEKLPTIIRNTLMYGDFFCEIGDEKASLTNRSILSEAEYSTYIASQFKAGAKENIICDSGNKKYKFIMDYTSYFESKEQNDKNKIDIYDLRLMMHEPKYVVRLQSSMVPVCFGFLVFPQMTINPQASLQDDAVNDICKSLLKNISNKVPQIEEAEEKDLKELLAHLVQHMDPTKAMNIRFVSPDKMVHFLVPTTKYYPYGESIFDASQFNSKLLMALQVSLAIARISRSTEKRKVMVEIGLPRDAQKAIQNLKEEFRKRKISLDSFGTIDTIPSAISTYEDIYIPQKDGKPYVDIQGFNEGNIDIRSKVDELNFIRDSIVAGLSVPPSFIGLETNLSNKSALSEESILFARAIISHQKNFKPAINGLIKKVLDIINPEEALTILDNIDITLPTPKSLQFERQAKYISDLSNLVESLERIGIPKEYASKKYLTMIDWNEVNKYKIDHDIDVNLDPVKKKEEEGGGLGGVGGMGTF